MGVRAPLTIAMSVAVVLILDYCLSVGLGSIVQTINLIRLRALKKPSTRVSASSDSLANHRRHREEMNQTKQDKKAIPPSIPAAPFVVPVKPSLNDRVH